MALDASIERESARNRLRDNASALLEQYAELLKLGQIGSDVDTQVSDVRMPYAIIWSLTVCPATASKPSAMVKKTRLLMALVSPTGSRIAVLSSNN